MIKKDKSKFNVSQTIEGKLKRTHNSILFASELECDYYKYLLQEQEKGLIKEIILQPKYLLQEKYIRKCDNKRILAIYYVADFKTIDNFGHEKVIDTKGMPKSDGILKRKMMEFLYPDVDFHWISWSQCDGGWVDYDLLMENRRARKKVKEGKNKAKGVG